MQLEQTSMHSFCFLFWLPTRSFRQIVGVFPLCLEHAVSSRMPCKIWRFWNKTGFLNYLSGSGAFCTVTCYFLWDANQTGGVVRSRFGCCVSPVQLLSLCTMVTLISPFCSHDLLPGGTREEGTSQTLSPLQAPGQGHAAARRGGERGERRGRGTREGAFPSLVVRCRALRHRQQCK